MATEKLSVALQDAANNIGFDIHFQADTLGSRLETTK